MSADTVLSCTVLVGHSVLPPLAIELQRDESFPGAARCETDCAANSQSGAPPGTARSLKKMARSLDESARNVFTRGRVTHRGGQFPYAANVGT
jgi:hypothetical protein